MDTFLKGVRGLVRPILTFAFIAIILYLIVKEAAQYLDPESAKAIIYFGLGSGTTILAYWFGERKQSLQ